MAGVGVRAVITAGAVVLGGVFGGGAPGTASSSGVVAQASTVPVSECVPGATIPANLPANGPSPVGRCEPTGGQRGIDTFVWLLLVAILGLLAVTGLATLVRSLRDRPLGSTDPVP